MTFKRHTPNTLGTNKGFTLIELVLALSLFSLILLIGYQAIALTSHSTQRLSKVVEQQQALRASYRSLDNAFKSMAPLKGDRFHIEFNLSDADSPWLRGSERIRFTINANQELWAFLDKEPLGTLLTDEMSGAEFTFYNDEQGVSVWSSGQRPQAIELTWSVGDDLLTWRFER